MKTKVFINGFGRIGRCAARIILEDERYELVGVNDIYDTKQMVQLYEFDSIYGKSKKSLEGVKLFCEKTPPHIECDVLLQCSGIHVSEEANQPYIKNGAKKIIVSAPTSNEIPTYIYGINHKSYKGEKIISNSSCSANAIVPIFDIIQRNFGIKSANLSMYHSYTAYQKLLDVKHYSKDIRRTRSATQNIIPLDSSAANETSKFFPHLENKIYAKSIRVPVSATTFYDLSMYMDKKSSQSKIEDVLKQEIKISTILDITTKPLVSTDFIQNPYSATVDLNFTSLVEGDFLRVCAWQDNEYGYAKRLIDMLGVVVRT
jgi:glyceraldehyde 3-phosphate dehydrogenase